MNLDLDLPTQWYVDAELHRFLIPIDFRCNSTVIGQLVHAFFISGWKICHDSLIYWRPLTKPHGCVTTFTLISMIARIAVPNLTLIGRQLFICSEVYPRQEGICAHIRNNLFPLSEVQFSTDAARSASIINYQSTECIWNGMNTMNQAKKFFVNCQHSAGALAHLSTQSAIVSSKTSHYFPTMRQKKPCAQ